MLYVIANIQSPLIINKPQRLTTYSLYKTYFSQFELQGHFLRCTLYTVIPSSPSMYPGGHIKSLIVSMDSI